MKKREECKIRKQDEKYTCRLLASIIKRSSKNREQIANEMSSLLGTKVTARMLCAFTAESREFHRWPGAFDIAFCEVVGDYSLLSERVRWSGFRMVTLEEERLIKIGRAYIAKAKAERILQEASL